LVFHPRIGTGCQESICTTVAAAGCRHLAIRWALTRISERPAYTQLREHARDIEGLKTEL
jgi:hypothetical protein